MRPVCIQGARLLDPERGHDGEGSVLIEGGRLTRLEHRPRLDDLPEGTEIVEAQGAALAPGLIDLRAQGAPAELSRIAAAAGVTTVVVGSSPAAPADSPAQIATLVAALLAARGSGARMLPAAAATQGMGGERLAEIGLLHEAGAVLISDGARAIGDSRVLRRVLRYAAGFGVPVAHRPVDVHLSRGAVAAEGEFAARLGLAGVPAVAERIGLERDVAIAEGTGAPLHLDGLSTAVGTAALAAAKGRGAPVTGAVAIAHLLFNEVEMGGLDTRFRLDPPLRPEADRLALIEGLADGTLDVVVSDHLPVPPEGKHVPYAEADPGGRTLHALLPALLSLHHANGVPLLDLLRCVTLNPARLLGLPSGRLTPSAPADLVLFDPGAPAVMPRLGSPFDGRRLEGRVLATWVEGRRV